MTWSSPRTRALVVLLAGASMAAAKMQPRHVFVHVVDLRGDPVTDLTASDFQLTEGGVARVVTHAAPATDPMRIALFLDTSDAAAPALTHMRAGAVALGARGATVHAFVFKGNKGGGTPDVIATTLTRNTGGRYDMMNTTNALPDKMKALAERLALDHRRMTAWYRIDFQTDAAEF